MRRDVSNFQQVPSQEGWLRVTMLPSSRALAQLIFVHKAEQKAVAADRGSAIREPYYLDMGSYP